MTIITITKAQTSAPGVRFDLLSEGVGNVLGASVKRWAALTWLTDQGLDPEHASNLLDEALVSPVSTEV